MQDRLSSGAVTRPTPVEITEGRSVSNIAGKAYALNVITPVRWRGVVVRLIFWFARTFKKSSFVGLRTLSLIHYARWVVIRPSRFPNLGHGQPREHTRYAYEMFMTNFNGSWNQYIDSFSMSIPAGLDLLWRTNVNYPKSVPIEQFHRYIEANQIPTDYYYDAYPLATSNDVKSAERVRAALLDLAAIAGQVSDDDFQAAYNRQVLALQHDLARMEGTPIVSLANEAVVERQRLQGLGR
jgi:hypothetical protein